MFFSLQEKTLSLDSKTKWSWKFEQDIAAAMQKKKKLKPRPFREPFKQGIAVPNNNISKRKKKEVYVCFINP